MAASAQPHNNTWGHLSAVLGLYVCNSRGRELLSSKPAAAAVGCQLDARRLQAIYCHTQPAQQGPSGLRLHQRSCQTEAAGRTYADGPSTVHMNTMIVSKDCPYDGWGQVLPAWNGSRRWVCTVKDHAWQPFRPYEQKDIPTNHACKHRSNQSGSAVPGQRPRTREARHAAEAARLDAVARLLHAHL